MKKNYPLTFIVSLMAIVCYGQTPIITPTNPYNTVCPNTGLYYGVDPSSNYTKCGDVTWTVTKGSFDPNTSVTTKTEVINKTVEVFWDDAPGNGTLKATSKCKEGTIAPTASFTIRSVKGLTPQNFHIVEGAPLDICGTVSRAVTVDKLAVPGTGYATGILEYDADGYDWQLSEKANWTGTNPTELVTLVPKNLCSSGNVQVRAYINTCSAIENSYSEYTSPISLRNSSPTLVVTGPDNNATYTQSCGSTDNVTFSVTPLYCTSSYTWTFPSGWKTDGGATSGLITSGPYVTLVPPPSPEPGTPPTGITGSVKATEHLGACGATVESNPLTIDYAIPAPGKITGPGTICTTASYSITDLPYGFFPLWSTGNSGFVTISSDGEATKLVDYVPSTIKAVVSKNGCTIPVSDFTVWLGKPYWSNFALDGAVPVTTGYCSVATHFSNSPPDHYLTAIPAGSARTTFTLSNYSNYTVLGQSVSATKFYLTTKFLKAQFCVAMNTNNVCGSAVPIYVYFSNSGDLQDRVAQDSVTNEVSVYPNPGKNTIQVIVNSDGAGSTTKISGNLYNLQGSLVKSAKSDNGTLTIDVQDLAAGEYYIHVDNGTEVIKKHVHISK